MILGIYGNPTANVTLKDEQLKTHYQELLLLLLLVTTELKDLAIAIKARREVVKPFSTTFDIVLDIENFKEFTRKLLQLINKFSKLSGYMMTQKSVVLL
jgi:hypothetical protein